MFDPSAFITQEERLPADAFDWGSIRWLCNDRLLHGAVQTLGICHLYPGKKNPIHYHPNCEELLYVLTGQGKHLLGEQWFELPTGATIRIPAGVHHQLANVGWEPLTCVIAFSSGNRETVFLE